MSDWSLGSIDGLGMGSYSDWFNPTTDFAAQDYGLGGMSPSVGSQSDYSSFFPSSSGDTSSASSGSAFLGGGWADGFGTSQPINYATGMTDSPATTLADNYRYGVNPLDQSTGDKSIANKGLDALKSLGSGTWDAIKQNPLMALSLGMAGYGALKGPQTPPAVGDLRKSTGQTLDYMKGRTAGVDKLTQGLTDKYSSGKIDPADERRIAQWTMAQKAQVENYYTKAGMPDSTAKINALKDIDAQALALTDQARQGYLQEAFKGMTLQAQATGQIANLQQSMNQTIAQLQQSGDVQAAQALQNLMYQTGLFAAQTRGTTQQTTTLPTV
jgi:hypothetical protein